MEILKRVGLWCAMISGITPIALSTPGLVAPGGKMSAILTFVMGAAGVISGLFAKQVFGKSDTERMAESDGKPADRATDVKP